jgi:hypothetical protein
MRAVEHTLSTTLAAGTISTFNKTDRPVIVRNGANNFDPTQTTLCLEGMRAIELTVNMNMCHSITTGNIEVVEPAEVLNDRLGTSSRVTDKAIGTSINSIKNMRKASERGYSESRVVRSRLLIEVQVPVSTDSRTRRLSRRKGSKLLEGCLSTRFASGQLLEVLANDCSRKLERKVAD